MHSLGGGGSGEQRGCGDTAHCTLGPPLKNADEHHLQASIWVRACRNVLNACVRACLPGGDHAKLLAVTDGEEAAAATAATAADG